MALTTSFDFLDQKSPLGDYKWGIYSPDELATQVFQKSSDKIKNTIVVTNTKEENDKWKEVVQEYFWDLDRDGVLDEHAFTLRVFISTEATDLQDAYAASLKEHKGDEISLFLEDNEGDDSQPFYAVVIGRDVGKILQQYKATRQDVKEFVNKNLQVDEKFLDALMANKPLEVYSNLSVYDILGKVLYTLNPGAFVVSKAGVWILEKIINLLKKKKVPPEIWLPSKRDENSPLNFIRRIVEEGGKEIEPLLESLLAATKENFLLVDKEIRNFLDADMGKINIKGKITDFSTTTDDRLVTQYYLRASNAIHSFLDDGAAVILEVARLFATLGPDMTIAFFSGIYNSLIEAVAGILTLVKWLLGAMSKAGDFLWDIERQFPILMEVLDEIFQALAKLDFSNLMSAIGKGLGKLWEVIVKKFSGDLLDSFCIISYFTGNIVGLVIELVVEALLTGGVAAVASLFGKLGSMGKVIAGIAGRIFKVSIEKAGKSLLGILKSILAFLKQGQQRVLQFIDEVMGAIRKWLDGIKSKGNRSEFFQKDVNSGRSSFWPFSAADPKRIEKWRKLLQAKGVNFKIGTKGAKKLLDSRKAFGLTHVYRYEKTGIIKNIDVFLYKKPSTVAFYEEVYHALQALDNFPMRADVVWNGKAYKDIDAWEFFAKKRILDERKHHRLSDEDVVFLEDQIEKVLSNTY